MIEVAYGLNIERTEKSKNLLIVPASRYKKNFEFTRFFRNELTNKLFLVSNSIDSWYQDGANGIDSHLFSLCGQIRALIDSEHFENVSCFGSSMGAYAALAIGCSVEADRVVAFSPQIELNKGWNFTPPESVCTLLPSLYPLIAKSSRTECRIITSTEFLDVYQASLVSQLENVEIALFQSPHNVLQRLKHLGLIDKTIHRSINGLPLELNTVTLDLPTLTDPLRLFLNLAHLKKHSECLPIAYEIWNSNKSWFDAALTLGRLYFYLRRFDEAQHYLFIARDMDQLNPTAYALLSAIAATTGKINEVEEALNQMALVLSEQTIHDAPYFAYARKQVLATRCNDSAILAIFDRFINTSR